MKSVTKAARFMVLIIFCSLLGCAVIGTSSISSPNSYKFEDIERVQIGSSAEHITTRFGKADLVFPIPGEVNKEYWFYFVPGTRLHHLQFGIDTSSKRVFGKGIVLYESDAPLAQKLIADEYPQDSFVKHIPPQTGHWIPGDAYYSNAKNTVKIHADRWSDVVKSVSWFEVQGADSVPAQATETR